jgi:thioesterase domain-containing protein
MVPHRAVVRLALDLREIGVDEKQTLLQLSILSSESSLFETWGALLNTARLGLLPAPPASWDDFARLLEEYRVTCLYPPTAFLRRVIDDSPGTLAGVGRLFIGGEALWPELHHRAKTALPKTQFVHVYQVTEGGGICCCQPVDEERRGSPLPIGKPLARVRAYVLDSRKNLLPVGVAGELYLGGDGVALGYLGQEERTSEAFVPDVFGGGGRLFRTGDRARILADGTIELLGRLSEEVSFRGARFHPGWVEAILNQHPQVKISAVVVVDEASGDNRVVAYVVAHAAGPSEEELRAFLGSHAPGQIVPDLFLFVPDLPLVPHGKVDRLRLCKATFPPRPPRPKIVHPRNGMESVFVTVWEEMLNQPVGIRDNFFDVGGNSILAVEMVARMEELCGGRLPLAEVFAGPTIEHLSAVMEQTAGGIEVEENPLVQVQAGAGKRPFFFMHGDFLGGGFYCMNLARYLGAEVPFHGLAPHGVSGQPYLRNLEAMAADHLERIRRVQPSGPYLLGGYCNGALEAFEMARQLQAAGQTVDLVVLISPVEPAVLGIPPLVADDLEAASLPLAQRRIVALWVMVHTCRNYPLRRYSGRVAFFQPEEIDPKNPVKPETWKALCERIEVHTIPGGHKNCITTHVRPLAQAVKDVLRRVPHKEGEGA